MTVSIMQPYFFPYVGYWQLIAQADVFVVLDDVNFIKKGWIHRNRIAAGDGELYLVNPVSKMSQNRRINEHRFVNDPAQLEKLLKNLEFSYRKEPFFRETEALVRRVLFCGRDNVAEALTFQIEEICRYLGISTKILRASELRSQEHGKAQEGILELVRLLGGDRYVNPIGGTELYDRERFAEEGVDLKFLQTDFDSLREMGGREHMDYSVIDLMMRYSPEKIGEMLKQYRLISN